MASQSTKWSARERLPVCPACGCVDQVQRVSAVCKAGSATTRGIADTRGSYWGYGRSGAFWGSSQATTATEENYATELSQVLAAPLAPRYRHPWGIVSSLLLIAVLLSGWWAVTEAPGLHCAPSGGRTICWDHQGSLFMESATGMTPDPGTFARSLQVGLVILPVSLLVGLLALRRQLGVRRRQRFEVDYAAWQQIYAWWEHINYCHRCDGVFAPGERRMLPPASWQAYCPAQSAV